MSSISSGTTSTTGYVVSSDTTGALVLKTGSAATTAVTIDTSQNVGIGTSTPNTRLEVGGDASPILKITSTSGPYSIIQSNTVGTLQLMADEGNTGASTSIRFRIDGAEVARFDSSGNLGLGVTPSAWDTGIALKAFQFSATGCVYGYSFGGNNFTAISNNFYINSSGTGTYLTTNTASQYSQSAGQHRWFTAPSGTAGNAISFTQAMTLDASGRQLLGHTSSQGNNSRLQVSGSAEFFGSQGGNGPLTTLSFYNTNSSGFQIATMDVITGANFYEGIIRWQTKDAGGTVAERVRIDSSGNLLVGTTTAVEKLTVAGNISISTSGNPFLQIKTSGAGNNPYIRLQADTVTWDIQGTFSNAGDELYLIYAGSNRGYFNSSTGAYTAVSDQRLKKNITDISYGLDAILNLRPVEYLMNDENDNAQKHLGFIAQEAQTAVPSSVSEMTDGMFGMDKTELIAVLVKGMQEQQAQITQLQADIAALKG